MKFWNFIEKDDGGVELWIEGEIVSDDDAWIYEWFGDAYTSPNKFREALAQYKGKDITVWIDTWGGDVFAGVGINSALMEHSGKIIVKVIKAVSAGTLPAMAASPGELWIVPGGIFMAHNPWLSTAGEAKDMRHAADVLDEVREAILNIYEKRTGRTRGELIQMMDNETWMSAKTAVAEKFADGILYSEIQEPAQNSYMVSGLAVQNSVDEAIRKFLEYYQKAHPKTDDQKPNNSNSEGNPANNLVFDIKKRVNVREKSNRRYHV